MWQTREDLGIASEGQQTCKYGSGSLTGALVTSLNADSTGSGADADANADSTSADADTNADSTGTSADAPSLLRIRGVNVALQMYHKPVQNQFRPVLQPCATDLNQFCMVRSGFFCNCENVRLVLVLVACLEGPKTGPDRTFKH
jgi:hypothetical protein